MTREEREGLIKHLEYDRSIGADYLISDRDVDEIIKALEQEPILDQIKAEVEKIYNDRPISYNHNQRTEFYVKVLQIIDKYKAEREK